MIEMYADAHRALLILYTWDARKAVENLSSRPNYKPNYWEFINWNYFQEVFKNVFFIDASDSSISVSDWDQIYEN